jgi:hypothetical protein
MTVLRWSLTVENEDDEAFFNAFSELGRVVASCTQLPDGALSQDKIGRLLKVLEDARAAGASASMSDRVRILGDAQKVAESVLREARRGH